MPTLVLSDATTGDRPDACRVKPTRTRGTLARYRREYAHLIRRAKIPCDADDRSRLMLAIWAFGARDHELKPASIRLYTAALRLAIDDLANAVGLLRWEIDALYAALDEAKPEPSKKGAPARTSAKKCTAVSPEEFQKVVEVLQSKGTATARLLSSALCFGVLFGVRPSEWADARLEGNTLLVPCGKRSNFRGVAEMRPLLLVRWKKGHKRDLARFLAEYRRALRDAGRVRFHERLAAALARACDEANVPRIALYTLRHQAIATAKRFMTADEVAAYAGQVSAKTAQRYAHKRGGWRRRPNVRPASELIERIRRRKREPEPDPTSLVVK
jgi:hypothetical protein